MSRRIGFLLAAVVLAVAAMAMVLVRGRQGTTGPIRVGILHSLSGTMAISEKSVADASLLAIEEINENGGLLGRTVEPVLADGRSDWPTFARVAEKLII